MKKLLEIQNLTKIYSMGSIFSRIRITAVEGVSFTVAEPEIFTLAGESGCGKTTTAKIILGFEEQTSGMILYKNEPISKLRRNDRNKVLREIQAVFQNPFSTFNPLRTVDSYFYETLVNLRIVSNKKEAEKKIANKLQAVGLSFEEFSQRYPSEFSGGQLQRLSIARALLTDPSLIIADEPVSMVDASLRMSIVNLFKDLKERYDVSVIYITHDLTTAYYISDRMAIMFRGNIVEMGPAEEVLSNPKHPYTRLLRESVPEPDPNKQWTTKVHLAESEHEEYLRTGCKFVARCPLAMEKCRKFSPPHFEVNGTLVKCFLYE